MRIALGVAYDGSGFHGWQAQRDPRIATVQGTLEAALAPVAGARPRLVCAGRTDAGVHATGQVCHFDTPAPRPERAWVRGTVRHLPPTVRVLWARAVGPGFHARFAARARSYRYVVLERPVPSPLLTSRVCAWRTPGRPPLDAAAMHRAAQALVGRHDFSSFRGAGCQAASPVRRIEVVTVRRRRDLITFDVTADAFLLHMVRNLVGTLLAVGSGAEGLDGPEAVAALLASRDRTLAPATAPAGGLYLTGVRYDPVHGVPGGAPEAPGTLPF